MTLLFDLEMKSRRDYLFKHIMILASRMSRYKCSTIHGRTKTNYIKKENVKIDIRN